MRSLAAWLTAFAEDFYNRLVEWRGGDRTLRVVVNGEEMVVAEGATVPDLVVLRKCRGAFAVEVNQELVVRGEYAMTGLREADQVEIVTLVGGG